MIHVTKENEVLDYICWKHYFQSTILNSLLVQETEQYDPGQHIMDIFDIGNITGRTDDQMGRIVNIVLQANPGLIRHGIFLPSGLEIQLPEIPEIHTAPQIVQLWD